MNLLKLFQKEEIKQKPEIGELAITNSLLYPSGLGLYTYNPDELARKKGGLRVYDDMRQDEQVKACLTMKKHSVLSAGWFIDGEEQELVDFINYVLNKMQGTINEILQNILTALDYGYSISELIWTEYVEGKYVGKYGYKMIKTKKPHLFNFDIDEYENLKEDGIILNNLTTASRLPINKFIIFTYQKEFNNLYGCSDLRPAYRNWWSKDAIIKFWNIYLERFGQPLTRGQYSVNDSNKIADLKQILTNLQSKTSIIHRKGDFEIDFLEAQRRATSDYQEALSYHNRAIARSILIPDKIAEGGDVGAYAQARVHFDLFLLVINQLRREIEENVMNEQIIKRLIQVNYGMVNVLPQFKFNPITDEQKMQMIEIFTRVVQAGAVLPNIDDQNKIRESLGFPIAEEKVLKSNNKVKKYKMNKRALSKYEKHVDFKHIDEDLLGQEIKVKEILQEILTKQRDSLTSFISSKILNAGLTTSLIRGLDLKYMGDLRMTFQNMFDGGYLLGNKDSEKELFKRFVLTQKQGMGITPQKAIDYLKAKSDFTALKIKEPILKDVKRVLLNSLRTGASVKATVIQLEKVYDPYLISGVIEEGEELAPYRLEAIIRTEIGEAYNYGRRAIGEDPDLADYVLGYEFSEILDSRTTEISREIDGMTIRIDSDYLDDLTYPLHWNDRGMFVFITKEDEPVEWTDEGILAEMAEWTKELKP